MLLLYSNEIERKIQFFSVYLLKPNENGFCIEWFKEKNFRKFQ